MHVCMCVIVCVCVFMYCLVMNERANEWMSEWSEWKIFDTYHTNEYGERMTLHVIQVQYSAVQSRTLQQKGRKEAQTSKVQNMAKASNEWELLEGQDADADTDADTDSNEWMNGRVEGADTAGQGRYFHSIPCHFISRSPQGSSRRCNAKPSYTTLHYTSNENTIRLSDHIIPYRTVPYCQDEKSMHACIEWKWKWI